MNRSAEGDAGGLFMMLPNRKLELISVLEVGDVNVVVISRCDIRTRVGGFCCGETANIQRRPWPRARNSIVRRLQAMAATAACSIKTMARQHCKPLLHLALSGTNRCHEEFSPPLLPGGRAAVGTSPSKLLLFIPRPLGIISRQPCRGAAQEVRYPAGTLGDIQAVTAAVSY